MPKLVLDFSGGTKLIGWKLKYTYLGFIGKIYKLHSSLSDNIWLESPIFQELLIPQCWKSQLVFSVWWNSKEVCSNSSEGTDLLARQVQAGKQSKLPSPRSLYRPLAEDMTQITGVSTYSKIQIRSGYTYFKLGKYPLQVCLPLLDVS